MIQLPLKAIFFSLIGLVLLLFILFPPDLWCDESYLAYSISKTNWGELHKPMIETKQSAPIGFLYLVKFCLELFGINDVTIKIPSTIALLLIFNLIFKLCKLENIPNLYGLIAMALFSRFWIFGFELKQYIFDVLGLLYLYFLISKKEEFSLKNSLYLLVISFFSNVTLALSIPFLLLRLISYNKKENNTILVTLLLIIINNLFFYFLFYKNNPIKPFMLNYWSDHFINLGDSPLFWIIDHANKFILYNISTPTIFFKYLTSIIITILFIIKLYKVSSINTKASYIKILAFITPFLFALILSILKLYPLDGERLSLYLTVPFIWATLHTLKSFKTGLHISFIGIILLSYSFYRMINYKIISPNESISHIFDKKIEEKNSIVFYGGSYAQHRYYTSKEYNGKKRQFWQMSYYNFDLNLNDLRLKSNNIIAIETHSVSNIRIPKYLTVKENKYSLINTYEMNYCKVSTFQKVN